MTVRHLVILAKAPRLGRAKRRLAADIGSLEALRFYRSNLTRTIRQLGRGNRWKSWLFVDDGDARCATVRSGSEYAPVSLDMFESASPCQSPQTLRDRHIFSSGDSKLTFA